MPDKTLHFKGDLRLQERNGEWFVEDRSTGNLAGPVNLGELDADAVVIGASNAISDPEGSNLSIDSNGVLNATDTDTQPIATGTSTTASGDGAATTFSLTHSLGVAPSQATVQPTSSAANGNFYVSDKTSSSVDITYGTAPTSGTDNLTYDLVLIE